MGISILIVDDDKLLVEKLEETVNWSGIGIDMVFTANNIRQAQKLLQEYPIEMLLCDIDMPQGNGLELLEWIRYKKLDIECAFLSSYANFAYAQMALKLSSREYLLKPISNADLEAALRKVVGVVQEKQQKQKKQESTNTKEKRFWEDLLVQCLQENYWIEQAKKGGYCVPGETFRLVLLRVLEFPSKEHYKKEISLYNFVINNVTAEVLETAEVKLETVVHVSDLEWAIVLRNDGRRIGTEDELEHLRVCLAKAVPPRFCMYVGKTVEIDQIPESRDRLEEMEKYAVPDETGILYETRWSFVEREYQEFPWKTYLAEMERSESLEPVREKLQGYLTERLENGGLRKDFTRRFAEELMQTIYVYLKKSNIVFGQIFDSDEYENKRREAVLSVIGARAFIDYLFDVLEGQKKNESHSDNVVDQLKDYIEQNLGEDLSRSVLAGKVFLSEDYVSKIFMKATGMSLPNYIAERRIERAKEYLRSSSLPISKIAMEVGYGNFSYFSKTFREIVGCTPNEYRSRRK